MRTLMSSMIAVTALLVMGSSASAQYPSSWYSYNAYPGGGYYNYSVSNGYETVSVYQSASYGSARYSYSYSGLYGSYSRYYNYSYPVYQPTYYHYPTYYGYPLYQSRVQYPIRR